MGIKLADLAAGCKRVYANEEQITQTADQYFELLWNAPQKETKDGPAPVVGYFIDRIKNKGDDRRRMLYDMLDEETEEEEKMHTQILDAARIYERARKEQDVARGPTNKRI